MDKRVTSGTAAVWIASAAPGAEVVYHEGFLARDRAVPGKGRNWLATTELDEAAATMYSAARMGYVVLTQKRLGVDRYHYLARRTTRRRTGAAA